MVKDTTILLEKKNIFEDEETGSAKAMGMFKEAIFPFKILLEDQELFIGRTRMTVLLLERVNGH